MHSQRSTIQYNIEILQSESHPWLFGLPNFSCLSKDSDKSFRLCLSDEYPVISMVFIQDIHPSIQLPSRTISQVILYLYQRIYQRICYEIPV